MDDELYPDDAPEEKEEDAPKEKSESKEKENDKDAHTELVGKKLLHLDEDDEIKEGTTCTFKVIKDWGDSVEISYVKKSKKDKDDSDDDEPMSADDELDSIDAMKG